METSILPVAGSITSRVCLSAASCQLPFMNSPLGTRSNTRCSSAWVIILALILSTPGNGGGLGELYGLSDGGIQQDSRTKGCGDGGLEDVFTLRARRL